MIKNETPGRRAGRQLRQFEADMEVLTEKVETVVETSDALMSAIISSLRFTTESMRITLLSIPYIYLPEYSFVQDRDYERGEAVRMGSDKWLTLDGARLSQNETPETSPRFLLHRDSSSFDPDGTKRNWVREELCLQDFWRWDESASQDKHGWYRVKTRLIASATPPPNDDTNWAFMGKENPKE
jgi:hypothetical protein